MPPRVLLVDDEPAILDLFKLALELAGFQVETADSAAAAVALLARRPYHLVLTDMRMETPTAGYDVVRAAVRLAPRPVIAVLSAFYLNEEECRHAGADAVFVKGLPVHELAKSLRHLVDHSPAPKGAEPPARRAAT